MISCPTRKMVPTSAKKPNSSGGNSRPRINVAASASTMRPTNDTASTA
ncbi:MAG: hypothetical protein R3F34_04525 [Planctomycetota bacterium]